MRIRTIILAIATLLLMAEAAQTAVGKKDNKSKAKEPQDPQSWEAFLEAVQLPATFSQKCFSQPWPIKIVKMHMVKEQLRLQEMDADQLKIVKAVQASKYRALVIGTNTAVLCAFNPGQGSVHGTVSRGFCEVGLYVHDCTDIMELIPQLEKSGVPIERRDFELSPELNKVAPGVGT